jgi:osmotically-inducible protein OsmY
MRKRRAPTVPQAALDYDEHEDAVMPHERSPTMRTNAHVILCAAAAIALAGCDRVSTTSADQRDATVGQKIDSALERSKENLAAAGKKTEEKLQEAGNKISAATDNAVARGKEAIGTAKEKTEASTAQASNEVRSSDTGHRLNDTAITASIKTDYLKDPDLSVLKIDVDTKDGVVTLNGLAADDAARSRAEKIAGSIKGVTEVRNFLTIKHA